jgi:hypothetical protein
MLGGRQSAVIGITLAWVGVALGVATIVLIIVFFAWVDTQT